MARPGALAGGAGGPGRAGLRGRGPLSGRGASLAAWSGGLLLLLLALPAAGLIAGTSPAELLAALRSPVAQAALGLSLRTTALSLGLTLALGTPLAWRLSRGRGAGLAMTLIELPVVMPPAVLGVALLETFGRAGWLGPALGSAGISLPFTTAAVVLAQVIVGAPLYVLTAAAAFRAVEEDLLLVARTLGAGPLRAWWAVAVPAAAPGLLSGAGLAWARALGEFGATLMFAGNLPGRTQTLPIAIYVSLERDMAEARALSVLLLLVAVALLLGLRAARLRQGD
ncbi:MAG: molybdate ABC transporter permease subunit [Alphaproteobacteria bacterium]|nr:molybdate ABC transporter permease subunit [Alphaproteobacteria bacterium]